MHRGSEDAVWIGLGSSLGDRWSLLGSALEALRCTEGFEVVRVSGIYETRPVGGPREMFLNAVAAYRTRRGPQEILDRLLEVEAEHGRVRNAGSADRTLDLDLLLVVREGCIVEQATESLRLPHPRIEQRDFVLAPWAELAPSLRLPSGLSVAQALDELPASRRSVVRRVGLVSSRPPGA